MAKVIAPLMSAEARGSVGAMSFSSTRVGNVVSVKNCWSPHRTILNTPIRAWLKECAQAWGALSTIHRDTWLAAYPTALDARNAFMQAWFNSKRATDTPVQALSPASTNFANFEASFEWTSEISSEIGATYSCDPPDDILIALSIAGTRYNRTNIDPRKAVFWGNFDAYGAQSPVNLNDQHNTWLFVSRFISTQTWLTVHTRLDYFHR